METLNLVSKYNNIKLKSDMIYPYMFYVFFLDIILLISIKKIIVTLIKNKLIIKDYNSKLCEIIDSLQDKK